VLANGAVVRDETGRPDPDWSDHTGRIGRRFDPLFGEMSALIRAEFGAPVMSVTVGWGSNAIAFAGPALNDVDRLRAVSTRARQIHDELGLNFQRLPALVNEYLQKVQAGPIAGGDSQD
jgi:hypothetical protein